MLLPYIKQYRNKKGEIIISILLSIIQTVSLLPVGLLIQNIFDSALPHKDMALLMKDLGIICLLFVVNACALLYNRKLTLGIIKSTIGTLRQTLVKTVLKKNRGELADTDSIHSKIVHDSERVDWMTSALFTQFIPGILITLGLSCILLYQNSFLFLITVISLPFLFGSSKLIGRHVKKRVAIFHKDFLEFSKGILFILKFHELILFSSAQKKELERQKEKIQNLRLSSKRMAWISTAYTILQSNILILFGIIVLAVGGSEVMNGNMTTGSLLSFYVILNLLSIQAKNSLSSIPVILEGIESLHEIMNITDNTSKKERESSLIQFTQNITFKNVFFSYPQSDFLLNNISFTISKHKIFGILGPSGAGKSTLLHLLLGFYAPQKGQIFFDEYPVCDIDLKKYQHSIGILSQDPLLFPGTIRENLIYGLDSIPFEKLEEVCKTCKIHEHIICLKDGYDSEVSERVTNLSGGQKQRIALARALLRNPELLILDEPDNNLDEETCKDILEEIRRLQITTIVITHNKNMKHFFDTIYEL